MPPSLMLWPAPLWPPLRTASSRPVSRASETTTRDVGASAGPDDDRRPRSMPPMNAARASS